MLAEKISPWRALKKHSEILEEIKLGRHVLVCVKKYHGHERNLSDGTLLNSESKIGQLHLIRNLHHLHLFDPRYRLQRFLADTCKSLIDLDNQIEKTTCELDALMGVSSLVTPRTASMLGFDYDSKAGKIEKIAAAYFSAFYSSFEDRKVDTSLLLKNFLHQHKRVATFWLSRNKLRQNQHIYQELYEKYKHTLPNLFLLE